jgi:hypothetical protein
LAVIEKSPLGMGMLNPARAGEAPNPTTRAIARTAEDRDHKVTPPLTRFAMMSRRDRDPWTHFSVSDTVFIGLVLLVEKRTDHPRDRRRCNVFGLTFFTASDRTRAHLVGRSKLGDFDGNK